MNETNNNRIRESLELIEPAEGAKERMLANIRRKAAEQASNSEVLSAAPAVSEESREKTIIAGTTGDENRGAIRKLSVLRRWSVAAAACLALAILGAVALTPGRKPSDTAGTPSVTASVTPDGSVVAAGPLTFYTTAAAMADAIGFSIDAPEGATDIAYAAAVPEFAEVAFSLRDREYALRASKTDHDFSGLYGDETKPHKLASAEDAMLSVVSDDLMSFFKLVWKKNGLVYILVGPGETPEEEIAAVYRMLR